MSKIQESCWALGRPLKVFCLLSSPTDPEKLPLPKTFYWSSWKRFFFFLLHRSQIQFFICFCISLQKGWEYALVNKELLKGKWIGINVIPFCNSYLKSLPFNCICKKKLPTYWPTLKIMSWVTAHIFKDGLTWLQNFEGSFFFIYIMGAARLVLCSQKCHLQNWLALFATRQFRAKICLISYQRTHQHKLWKPDKD